MSSSAQPSKSAKPSHTWGMQLPIQSQSTIFVQPWEGSAGPDELLATAIAAEEMGADYVAVCDHPAIPKPANDAMGDTWYDTIATLAWLGGKTERVRLLSHIYVLPYRSPVITAKAFATLDLLTGGRAILGVGAGHLQPEFELIGADFESRGSAMNSSLETIEEILTTGEHRGAIVDPGKSESLPIWIGGSSKAALRRAVKFGNGWLPQGPPKGGMVDAIKSMREERRALHGPDDVFTVGTLTEALHIGEPARELGETTTCREAPAMAARLTKYLAVGADQIQVRFDTESAGELANQIGLFGTEVWPEVLNNLEG